MQFVRKTHAIRKIVICVIQTEILALNVLISIILTLRKRMVVFHIPVIWKTVRLARLIPRNVKSAMMVMYHTSQPVAVLSHQSRTALLLVKPQTVLNVGIVNLDIKLITQHGKDAREFVPALLVLIVKIMPTFVKSVLMVMVLKLFQIMKPNVSRSQLTCQTVSEETQIKLSVMNASNSISSTAIHQLVNFMAIVPRIVTNVLARTKTLSVNVNLDLFGISSTKFVSSTQVIRNVLLSPTILELHNVSNARMDTLSLMMVLVVSLIAPSLIVTLA